VWSPDRYRRTLPKDVAAELFGHCRVRTYERNEVIFREAELGDTLHLIRRGLFAARIQATSGEMLVLNVLGPGEVFGELSALSPVPRRTSTIVSLEGGETGVITWGAVEQLGESNPAVLKSVASVISEDVHRLSERLLEAVYLPARIRLLRRLLEVHGLHDPDEGIHLTQELLASLAWASRQTVNRTLQQEAARGTIEVTRGAIRILDRERLLERASRGEGAEILGLGLESVVND
jgi:CRP/FNR family cyclic AMP-dependent transcriptional regulator